MTAAALLLVLLLPRGAAATQASADLSVDAFLSELSRVSADVEAGVRGQVPDVQVPASWIVDAGGERYELAAGWIRTSIESARRDPATWPAQRTMLLAKLRALREEAAMLSTREAAGGGRPGARAVLADVLSATEFRRMRQQSATARLWEAITGWLLRVWERFGGGRLGRQGTAVLFAWIAVLVALVLLVAWLARVVLRPERSRGGDVGPPLVRPRSARAWASAALEAADPREAIRCAYRAAVRGLEEEGVWRVDDTRTPREYLRLLPPDHRRYPAMADVGRRFEEIWFGARAASDDDRRAVVARLVELGCLRAG